jgi:hypothetical protein
MRYRACLGVAVGLLAVLPAAGGETFAIRLKAPAVGDTLRVEKEETRTTRTTVYDGAGQKLGDEQKKQVETLVYTETVLALSPDGQPVSLRRRYEKAQLKSGHLTNKYAYQGKTVFIHQGKDGKYRFEYDGGKPITAEDADVFEREFNGADEKFRLGSLLPAKPVPVGAEWPVDMTQPVRDLSRTGRFAVDANWASGKGQLSKSTPVKGSQFGQVVYHMEIPILAMTVSGPVRSPVVPGSKATFELTLDMCIDGSRPDSTINGSAEVKAVTTLSQPGALPGRLVFSHKCDNREVRKAVEK